MTEHGTVVLNGLEFSYLVAGPEEGEPTILLHGFPQFADVWSPLLRRLGSEGFRAVAPDQRGYSRKARPVDVAAYAVSSLTSDVLALADHFGWSKFHLVGHDWGGFLAWVLAAKHHDRVRSLSVLSTPHVDAFLEAGQTDPDQKARSQYIQFFKMPGQVAEAYFLAEGAAKLQKVYEGKVPKEQVTRNLERLLEPGALTAAINWYRALDLNARVGAVSAPTLFLWGDGDIALGRAPVDATRQYMTGPYRLAVLAGKSHWLQDDAAEEVGKMILEHLEKYRSGLAGV